MKKFLFVLLVAALALPMMAQKTAATKADVMRQLVDRTFDQGTIKPIKAFDWTFKTPLRGQKTYVWDFEEDADYEGWMSLDNDGDGYGWEVESYYAYSGDYSLTSRSYYGGALEPDNWLISPVVPLGGVLTFYGMNYSATYPDKFEVYVCLGEPTTTDDFISISEFITPPTSWEEYSFDLSAYAGAMGCFAIRHYDCVDEFRLFVDYFTLTAEIPDAPVDVTVDPVTVTPTTANVTWEDPNNTSWNLRYMEVVPGAEENLLWDFEEDTDGNTNTELTGGWTSVDADGDGYDWYHLYGVTGLKTHSGTGHVTSASYNGTALTPDNWLISPEVKLDGELSFWACGQDPSYAAEVFAVYASTDGYNWEPLSEDITATGEMTEYKFDLTVFEGEMGYVAIRHYNTYDMFRLNIDDIAINYVQPAEWVYVEGIDVNNYTIEGLTPETEYIVEVQGVTDGLASDWTEAVTFTTPAEGAEPTEMTAAPVFNGYTTDGIHAYFVEILPTEPSVIYYRVLFPDGTWTEWAEYEDILSFTGNGMYRVEAYAVADGKLPSYQIAYEFYVSPTTGLTEMVGNKTVASQRYFNALGQEMQEANGMTIVVTTYTDGTTSTVKVVK